MNSSMIGKIEKAHRYAQETDRVTFNAFDATIRGDNDDYRVRLTPEGWDCSCPTFRSQVLSTCSHVMAMQVMLRDMLSEENRYSPQLADSAAV
jgi:predicted nucleic acid-binding Zn finger protein